MAFALLGVHPNETYRLAQQIPAFFSSTPGIPSPRDVHSRIA